MTPCCDGPQVESVTAGEIIASAARGDVAKLKKAIEAGNDLNTVDDHGKTALMVGGVGTDR
jgi:hypothetical protein